MANSPVEKVRGMLDLLPDDLQIRQQVASALEEQIARFGYRTLELPLIEQTELFLRKSGQQMATKLYAFRHHNRDLCLRPEVTPSVLRAYLVHLQQAGLPLRLGYTGPVFRYETPQRGRYRQFTEIGVELLGGSTPAADAEVIGLAATGLEQVGLHDYHIVIGHIGIAQSYLAGLQLDERVRDWLAWSMEDLRQHGDDRLHHGLSGLVAEHNGAADETGAITEHLREVVGESGWANLTPEDAQEVVLSVLTSAGFDLTGSSRDPAEIAQRMIDRLQRPVRNRDAEIAIDFLRRLAQLRGEPARVLAELRELLTAEDLSHQPIQQLEELLTLLDAYGVATDRVTLNVGLGRGLHYYTGPIFEIYDGPADSDQQLAGGGRYDELATVLGARERLPACGFAYGLERIVEALQRRQAAPAAPQSRPDCIVCAISADEAAHAARVAQHLRAGGQRVELDIRQRGVRANLELANRRGVPVVVIVGADEQRAGTFTWKDMQTGEQVVRSLPSPTAP